MEHFKQLIPILIGSLVGLLLLQILSSCGGVHYDSYVEEYKDIAMKEMQRTGYPASIKLAQAILESEGGRSPLAHQYNNHFGILCGRNWPGKKYYQEERDFQTGDSEEICYRVYNNSESSFVAHTDLLRTEYRPLFHNMDPMDYVAWANRLADLSYSENEEYEETLIGIIERYRLNEFDEIAMGFDDRPTAQTTSTYSDDREYDYDYDPAYEQEERNKNRTNKYREGIEELEEDITDHRRKYYKRPKKNGPSDRYEDDYPTAYEESSSSRRAYEETNFDAYEEEDDYYEPMEREDRVSSRPKESTFNDHSSYSRSNPSSKFDPSDIDRKYDGFSEPTNTYTTSSRSRRYEDSRSNRYEDSRNNRYEDSRSNRYESASHPRQKESTTDYRKDEWQEVENTSISDFRMAEDFAYINGVKVTTARYDDTPLQIARRFNLSVKDIIRFNEKIKKNNQLLREDQKVFLATKKKNYNGERRFHIVQFGERMEDIADLYGLSLSALCSKNKMPMGSEPALGEKIKLDRGKAKKCPELRYKTPKPLSKSSSYAPPKKAPPSMPINEGSYSTNHQQTTLLLQPVIAPNTMYHVVQPGETLYRIAQQYATSTGDLRRMNNLSSNTIKSGWRLKVK